MRVLCVPAGADASANLRLVWPALTLASRGYDVAVAGLDWRLDALIDGDTVRAVARPPADVLVLQRLQRREFVAAIPLVQAHGVAVVVDVDDDFAAVDPQNTAYAAVHPRHDPEQNFRHLADACRVADLVTVTTPALAATYGAHGRVAVLPNRLPEQVLSITHTDHDPLRIGWAGDIATHPRDLQVTRGAVGRVCAERGLPFVNVGPGGIAHALDLSRPEEATGYVEARSWFARIAAEVDVEIAPLADTRFNAAKSGLHLLTASTVGVPCVASPTPDNRRLHAMGMGELAAKPKDWSRHLHRLAADPVWRAEVAARSREAAAGEVLEAHVEDWWSAWALALEHRRTADERLMTPTIRS